MARIRTIKPDFWKHEDLSELPPETHMLAAALLNYADDEGYFKANPKLVQADCCPLREDSTNVRRMLEQLEKIGYIRLFEGSDGKKYGCITKFLVHQRVDRPKESTIKDLEDSTKDRRKIDDESLQEGKGREGKDYTQKPSVPSCPVEEIIQIYKNTSVKLPAVRVVADATKANIRARWRQDPKFQTLEFWKTFFEYCENNAFLSGQSVPRDNKPPFRASLQWVVLPQNFAKIINGDYDR